MFAERFYSGHWDPLLLDSAIRQPFTALFSSVAAPPQYLRIAEFFRLGGGGWIVKP